MDALLVCLILAVILLAIIAFIENAIDRFRVKRMAEDLDRHQEQRQRTAARQKAEAAAPIAWTAPEDHLDLTKIIVHEEPSHWDRVIK